MSRSILEYLDHILEETGFLLKESENLHFDDFTKDDVLIRAFIRSLEIIGEATKNIPPEIRDKYPDIEWKKMAGMRDKLVHAYFGIDLEIVWTALQQKIPSLHQQIKTIIQDLEE